MSIGSSPFQGGGSASIADATESTAGKIRISTTSESNTGTNDTTAMTPAKVKARIDAALVGGVEYKGSYTGQSLVTAEQGDLYVSAATYSLAGVQVLSGDHIIFNQDAADPVTSAMFDKIDNTDQVSSVNGQTSAVNIYADDSTLNIAGAGLSISGSGATSTLNADSASESTAGIIEIATNAEATAGSATDKALVPSNLSSVGTSQLNNDAGFITSVSSASDTTAGIIEIATNAEATSGSATDKALVPSNLSSVGTSQLNNDAGFITSVASASDTTAGIIEIATNAEATSGSATDKALVPSNLSSVGTSQLNNDAGFITSAGVSNQITTVVRTGNSTSITAVVNALYSVGASSATITLPSSSLSEGDLVGVGAQGSDKTNTVVSGTISNSNNTNVSSVTFTASRRGVVWFAYDSDSSKWIQLNDPTNVSSATEAGIIEIATNAEATAGSATDKALVPSNLSSVGTSQLNNDAGFITSVASASDSAAGIIEIATNAEATAGSATDKALVPSNLSSIGTSQLNNDAGFVTSSTGGVTPTLTVRGATSYTLTAANAKGVHVWYGGTTSATFTLTLPAISDVISTATTLNGDPQETFEVYVGRRVAGDITVSATDTIDVLGDGSYSYSATQTVRSGQWIKIIGWYNSATTGYQYYFMSGSSQPYDAGLESISGLTTTADKMLYTTGSDTYAVTDLTTAGRDLLDDADAAAQRTTLGLVIGTDVLSDVVQDTTPQLGGDLDVNGQDISTTSGNAKIGLKPHGTGFTELIGNTTGGNNPGAIRFNCEQNSHGVIIKSPLHDDYTVSQDYTLTLPTGLPSSDKVLQSSSTGVLSWVAQSGGGSVPGVTNTGSVNSTPYPSSGVLSSNGIEEVYLITPAQNTVVNIPAASTAGAGYKYQIKNLSASYNLTITPASGYIDSSATSTYTTTNQFESITLISDGSNWYII